MLLSVIVPVYNMAGENKLNFCMDSLVNQTVKDFEIIAVDDASTDNSLEVLRGYEAKYPDLVKVITYPDNRHQGGARNEGMKAAKGEWISFIDSDDWIVPDYFERLIKKAEETGADVVGTDCSIVHDHTYEVGKVIKSDLPTKCGVLNEELHKALLAGSGSAVMKIYRRELIFDNNLFFPEHMFYEDNAMGPVWTLYYKHFEFIDEPLYYYYQRSDSTIHTVTEDRCRDRMKATEITIAEMKKRGFYETYKDAIETLSIRLYIVNTLFGYMISCKKKHYGFVKDLKKGVLKYFPNFRENALYDTIPDAEQKKMLDLFMKNSFAFYVYYGALWKYRNLRAKLSGKNK